MMDYLYIFNKEQYLKYRFLRGKYCNGLRCWLIDIAYWEALAKISDYCI